MGLSLTDSSSALSLNSCMIFRRSSPLCRHILGLKMLRSRNVSSVPWQSILKASPVSMCCLDVFQIMDEWRHLLDISNTHLSIFRTIASHCFSWISSIIVNMHIISPVLRLASWQRRFNGKNRCPNKSRSSLPLNPRRIKRRLNGSRLRLKFSHSQNPHFRNLPRNGKLIRTTIRGHVAQQTERRSTKSTVGGLTPSSQL
jgi:hypothetical protein